MFKVGPHENEVHIIYFHDRIADYPHGALTFNQQIDFKLLMGMQGEIEARFLPLYRMYSPIAFSRDYLLNHFCISNIHNELICKFAQI